MRILIHLATTYECCDRFRPAPAESSIQASKLFHFESKFFPPFQVRSAPSFSAMLIDLLKDVLLD